MNLQEMLGDAFREDMTIEEINSALSDKKFADLSTGAYVDKNKYEADIKAKDNEIQKKAQELHSKMTADEQAQAEQAQKDALIEQLQNEIKASKISNSKSSAESAMSEIKSILDIKDDDSSYNNFINAISSEDTDSTKTLASYINKLVKDSYEKGKKDATKDGLGKFGSDVGKQGTTKKDDVGNFGKLLAEDSKPKYDPNTYFQQN